MVAIWHRETTSLNDSDLCRRIGAEVDDLWQAVQPGPFSEKQIQWLMLQLCLVNVGVTEWIESSRLDHIFKTNYRRNLKFSNHNWYYLALFEQIDTLKNQDYPQIVPDSVETTIHQLKCLLKLVAYSAFESFDLLFHSLWSPHSMCLSKNSTSSNFCNVSHFEQSWQLLQIKVAIIIPFWDHSKRTCAQFHRFVDPPPLYSFVHFQGTPSP